MEIDFSNDIATLASKLPMYDTEIPVGSFVVVGYSVSTYMGNAGGLQKGEKTMHVGCNILWAVLCGTSNVTNSDSE
jgi:hypothetical protein